MLYPNNLKGVQLEDRFLKALLNKIPQEMLKVVMDGAPQDIQERYNASQQEKQSALSPQSFFIQPRILLEGIDSSWYEDIVFACPESFRSSALQALREEMMGKLNERKVFSDPVRRFLLQVCLSRWPDRNIKKCGKIVFPLFARDCSKELLCSLADLICLHDIVEEVKKTVEKKKLQKILIRFSFEQQRYLKTLLQGARSTSIVPFEMESFLQADVKEASQIFREIGLKKLGQLLKEEEESTMWHIFHMMDKKDSFFLQEGKSREKVSYDLEQVKKHTIHALQFLQRK